jgi:peptide/nickel transport system permease protein
MRQGFVRFARNRMALFGAAVLLCLLLLVMFTPVIYPDDPFKLAGPALQPPGGRFPLGTDTLGRDVAAEIAYGARTSLVIGVGATLAAIVFGAVVGGMAGYYRGRTETVLMRITEFFQTIPAFIFALLIVAILSPSVSSEIIAIAAVSGKHRAARARNAARCVAARAGPAGSARNGCATIVRRSRRACSSECSRRRTATARTSCSR